MTNIVGFNEFSAAANSDLCCWLCQKAVSSRALFCHHCGTIQPVRALDHFTRLGLERRIDIDMDQLDRQYVLIAKTLDPERFLVRGMGERGHATKQLEAVIEAYDTLREPLRRGRYWLALHEKQEKGDVDHQPLVIELRRDLDTAHEPAQCDRVAQRAGQAIEQGVMGLLQALRGQNWQQANIALTELDGLEGIMGDVRAIRERLMPVK